MSHVKPILRWPAWAGAMETIVKGIPPNRALEIPIPRSEDLTQARKGEVEFVHRPDTMLLNAAKKFCQLLNRPYAVFQRGESVYVQNVTDLENSVCECGLRFANARKLAAHINSLGKSHECAMELQKIASDETVTHSSIAEKIGVSRELVHQLAERLGLESGRERQHRRRERRIRETVRPVDRWVTKITPVATQHGLKIVPMGSYRVRLNEKVCLIRSAPITTEPRVRTGKNIKIVLNPIPFRKDFDFALFDAKEAGWFVIPRAKFPKKGTTFMSNPEVKMGAKSSRHDYQSYRERWELLK